MYFHNSVGMSFVSQTVAGLSQARAREPPAPPRQHCAHQHAQRQLGAQLSRKNSLPEWDPPEPRARKNSLPADILDRVTGSGSPSVRDSPPILEEE